MRIRLGTRGSRLALVQTGLVADRLRRAGNEVELVPIVTEGDLRPVDMVPGEGVFVAAIAQALRAGEVEVLVLAAAGVDRLGQGARIDERLDPKVVPPAPAQGALAVQARSEDKELLAALGELDDGQVRFAVETERAVLEASGGGCRAPLGALVSPSEDGFRLLAFAVLPDGRVRGTSGSGAAEYIRAQAREIGQWLAEGFRTP